METGITKSYYCKVSRVENDAGFNAMEEGITKSYYCNGPPDVNDACLIAMEAGIYDNYRHASSDENKACFTAIEAGKLILIIHTYSSTKITRVSLQSKVDKLISMLTRILRRK